MSAFEDFMAQCRKEEWTAARREIFGMNTAEGIGDGSISRSPNPLRSPSGEGCLNHYFHACRQAVMLRLHAAAGRCLPFLSAHVLLLASVMKHIPTVMPVVSIRSANKFDID